VDDPTLPHRDDLARPPVGLVLGETLFHEVGLYPRLRGVAKGRGAAGRAALDDERALHLANALAGDVLLELGGGSRDLEDELAMCGLVVELAAEGPELDVVAAEDLDEALLHLEVPPETVLVAGHDAEDLAGLDIPHELQEGR